MVRSTIALLALGLTGLAFAFDPWHPEWGPSPPVAPYGMANLPSQKVVVPMIFPVLGESRWQDGYGEVRGTFRHTGIDIKAAKMTPIVAPFSGKLGMKPQSFWIYGDNGWMMLGTHLNDDNLGAHDHRGDRDVMFAPDVHPGQHVAAGQFIGYVGESGDATAPHLHFEIYAPGSGSTMSRIRDPFFSLKAAKIIAAPIPTLANPEIMPDKGDVRLDGCIRKIDQQARTITLLLTSIEYSTGQRKTVTTIQYRKVKLSPEQLQIAGGWSALRSLPSYQSVSVYLPDGNMARPQPARAFTLYER